MGDWAKKLYGLHEEKIISLSPPVNQANGRDKVLAICYSSLFSLQNSFAYFLFFDKRDILKESLAVERQDVFCEVMIA